MRFTLLLLIVSSTLFLHLKAANILFLNSAVIAQSHVFFTGKLADVLVDAGHNVTFYQQIGFTDLTKIGSRKAHIIVRQCDHAHCRDQPTENVWASGDEMMDNGEFFSGMAKAMAYACESQLNDKNLTDMFRAAKFDLVIAEHFDYCAHALADKAGIKKTITASAIMIEPHILNLMGNPTNLAFTPGYSDDHGSQLTYLQRAKALLLYPIRDYFMHNIFYKYIEDAIAKNYRPDFHAADAIAKSSYVFVNIDEHLAFQQPLSDKFIYVGGVGEHIGRDHVLPEKFNKILEESKKGVILISFGTIAQSYLLPEETKHEFIEVFKAFPDYDFIWKYEVDDDIAANLSNVHKVKWTPQSDLLAHPKLLAFVTHGGLNSMSETAHKGKPFVCIPLFGDQNRNCFSAQEKGLAEMVEKLEMTTENLVHALKTVLQPEYQKRAFQFAKMMADKPFQPADRVVGFVNHALKHDVSTALDLPGRQMTTIQYYFIDVIVPLAIVVMVFLYASYRVAKESLKVVRSLVKTKLE